MPHALRIVCCVLALSCSGLSPVIAQAPSQQHGFCHGLAGNPRVFNFTPIFPMTTPHLYNLAPGPFLSHLHQRYGGYTTQEYECRFFATEAEAQRDRQQVMDAAREYPAWPVVEIDWTPKAQPAPMPAAPAAAATPPAKAAPAVAAAAPAKASTPAATAAVTPEPAAPAVAAKPASPAPAKPATVAAKPAVYVICRADWNPDLRNFYNPPVDGRGAGYPEWQASWHQYLVARHKFKESNFGCTKYPTREEAQAGFEEWVVNARQTPTTNGQPARVIITNWKY